MPVPPEARPEGQQQTVLTVPHARFEAGKICTIIVDVVSTRGTPWLEAVTVEDQFGEAETRYANTNVNMNMDTNRY